jgi:N utilization substance protein A
MEALDVDDVIAHLLVTEGFSEDRGSGLWCRSRNWPTSKASTRTWPAELQTRAQTYLEQQNELFEARRKELGVTDELAALESLTPAMLAKLGEAGVKTLDDLGDLAGDELRENLGPLAMGEEEANAIIMAARAHWFEDEDAEAKD